MKPPILLTVTDEDGFSQDMEAYEVGNVLVMVRRPNQYHAGYRVGGKGTHGRIATVEEVRAAMAQVLPADVVVNLEHQKDVPGAERGIVQFVTKRH